MIDLHTHILPRMDDGAKTSDESLQLLQMQGQQGVSRCALTPHFYSDREDAPRFLARRRDSARRLAERVQALSSEERAAMPTLYLGAEVAWSSHLNGIPEIPELCLAGTDRLLLELPFTPWSASLPEELYRFAKESGVTPILAHLERYESIQPKELFRDILLLGFCVQVGCGDLLRPLRRGRSLQLLKSGADCVLASDCHDLKKRVPNLRDAMAFTEKKLGSETGSQLQRQAELLLAGGTALV